MSDPTKYINFIQSIANECIVLNSGKISKEDYNNNIDGISFDVDEIVNKYFNTYYTVGSLYYFLEHIKNRKVSLNVTHKTDISSVLHMIVREGVMNDVEDIILI